MGKCLRSIVARNNHARLVDARRATYINIRSVIENDACTLDFTGMIHHIKGYISCYLMLNHAECDVVVGI